MKMTDELIKSVKEYKNGNAEAFNSIYEQSYAYLHTCVIHVVKNEDVAQDMIQDTYMEIIKNISSLEKEESFLSWAAMIANRKCFARIKKNQELLVSVSDEEQSDYFENIADDEAFIPENVLDNQAKVDIIKGIIDELSDVQRACVIGFYYNEQKQDKIAEELGIPVNTVKSHLNRAKAKIKESVGDTEKKQGIKLYSIAPFMLLFFTKEVKACELVPMSETLASTAGIGLASTIGKSSISATKGIIAKGIAKWKIATIVGSVAIAGTIGATAFISQNKKVEEPVQAVEEPTEEDVEEIVENDIAIPEIIEEKVPETFCDKYGIAFSDSNNFNSKFGIVPYVKDENDNKVRQDIPGVELWPDDDYRINIDECSVVKSEKDGYVDVSIETSFSYVIGFTKDVSQVDQFSFYVVWPEMFLADCNTGIVFPAQGTYGDVDYSYTLIDEGKKYDISYTIQSEEDGVWGEKNYTSDNVYTSNLTGTGTKIIKATIPVDYSGLMMIISKDESIVTDEEWNDFHNFDLEEYLANATEEYLDECVDDYYYIKIPELLLDTELEDVKDETEQYDKDSDKSLTKKEFTKGELFDVDKAFNYFSTAEECFSSMMDHNTWDDYPIVSSGTILKSDKTKYYSLQIYIGDGYNDDDKYTYALMDGEIVVGDTMFDNAEESYKDWGITRDEINSYHWYVCSGDMQGDACVVLICAEKK